MEFNKLKFVKKDLDEFRIYLKERILVEPTTIQTYSGAVHNFLNYCKDEITQEAIDRFIKKKKRHYVVSGLKYYFKFKKLHYELPEKLKEPAKQRDKGEIPEVSRYELKKIIENFEKEDIELYYFFKLLNLSGLRIREALSLRLKNLDLSDYSLTVKIKGGGNRYVPLPKEYLESLFDYLNKQRVKKSDYIFFRKKGKEKEEEFMNRYMRLRYAIETTLKRETFKENNLEKDISTLKRTHNFRRGLINYLLEDLPIDVVADFISHKSIQTTQIYKSQKRKKENIMKAFEKID